MKILCYLDVLVLSRDRLLGPGVQREIFVCKLDGNSAKPLVFVLLNFFSILLYFALLNRYMTVVKQQSCGFLDIYSENRNDQRKYY
jgi:hypothetical protein